MGQLEEEKDTKIRYYKNLELVFTVIWISAAVFFNFVKIYDNRIKLAIIVIAFVAMFAYAIMRSIRRRLERDK